MGRGILGGAWGAILILVGMIVAAAAWGAEAPPTGLRMRLEGLHLLGSRRIPQPVLRDVLGLHVGQLVSIAELRRALASLDELGIFATITPQLRPGDLSGIVLTVRLQELPVLHAVRIEGPKHTADHVIRRELALKAGSSLTRRALDADLARLDRLGFFRKIEPSVVPASASQDYDLIWAIQERDTSRMRVLAGWSTLDGPLAAFRLSQDNFRGLGQSLGLSLSAGRLFDPARPNFAAEIGFMDPWIDPQRSRLDASVYLRRNYLPMAPLEDGTSGYQDERTGASLSLGRPLGDPMAATWRLGFTLRGEQTEIDHVEATGARSLVGPATAAGTGRDLGLSACMALSHDSRDDARHPHEGAWLRLGIEQYFPVTALRLTRATIAASLYRPIWAGCVLALGTRAGWAVDPLGGRVPFYQRFSAVEDQAIRGWPEGQLFGSAMAEGSLEARFPIWGPLGGVLFLDSGAFWSPNDPKPDLEIVHSGFGAGVRIETPLGLLRLDYGLARWGGDGVIAIGVGPKF